MKLERTKNTLRNTLWGLIYRIVTLIGPFIVKTILVYQLGVQYSGLSSLFTSILTVLNLTNLGFNSAIVFTMYKAIVDDDLAEQCAMVNLYKKAYRIVGIVILLLGAMVMPFLPHLVKGSVPHGINLYVLFAIYLSETVFGYFIFAYNEAIFTAYQRNDITLKISTVRYGVQYVLQCLALILFHNYYIYIIIAVLMVIPNNVVNHIVCKKLYPQIKCEGHVDKEVKKDISTRVITLFGHRLGNTMLVSVDSIIISSFLGLTIMGIYANYYYILTAVNAIVEILTNGALSGIGNKLFTDTREDNYRLFKVMTYGWLFIVGLAGCCMLALYQPFIGGIWYNAHFLLPNWIVVLIVIYFYSWMFRIMQLTFRDASGLWTKDWLKPYIAMIINTVGSIWMVKATGSIAGALVPTIFVFWLIYFPWEGYVLSKYLFKNNLLKYMSGVIGYTLVSVLGTSMAYWLCMLVTPANSLVSFLIRFPIAVIVYVAIWILFTHRRPEYGIAKKRFTTWVNRRI